MKKVSGFLFSAPLMAVLLAVFAVSIAAATFIENDFGSLAARAIVYNARWFEILILLGCINCCGRIVVKRLYIPSKFSLFLFHLSFVVIFLGAALTRYTGWEGTFSVREGSSENRVLSDISYITVESGQTHHFKVNYSPFRRNHFSGKLSDHDKFKLRVNKIIPDAWLTVEPSANGNPVAEFIYADSAGRSSVVLEQGDDVIAGKIGLCFSDSLDTSAVILSVQRDTLFFRSPFTVTSSSMDGSAYRMLEAGINHPFIPRQLYSFNGQTLVLNSFFSKGKITAQPLPPGSGTYDAVILQIASSQSEREVIVLGKRGYPGVPRQLSLNDENIIISYGSIYRELPFELKLNNFILERYPGSRSPSSFESLVQLNDISRGYTGNYRIYMNNILKYRGYRFYQSSYDSDEKGTVLSVNRDLIGTPVTYTGYVLLGIGMIICMFNKNSRFRKISAEIGKYRDLKNAALGLIFIITSTTTVSANNQSFAAVPDAAHAAQFGRMLVQDNSGRIEPVSTLSSEVLRKLMRDNKFRGMNSNQVLLGMCSDPVHWQHEPLIRTTNSQMMKFLGSNEKYHSFSSFFRDQSYILQDLVAEAYRKKPASRTKFDNEVIKLDEKVNICYLVFTGELLRVFPIPDDSTHTWYSHSEINGRVLSPDSVFTKSAFAYYTGEVRNATQSGNWKRAEEMLHAISQYQLKYSEEIIPSSRQVNAEIFLNRTDIFSGISKFYGIIGFILLVLHFISLFVRGVKTKVPLWTGVGLIGLLFIIHTAGLGLRWYVSGHAPFSNGYEALIYVAWACASSGLVFARKSTIAAAVGSILAFLILFVAHLSWMDPQITNLVPVLKSYWLVIHVATITASYGFLAMGALLAYLNLLMISLHTDKNRNFIRYTVLESTGIIEMALTVGLYMLTMGVFLGAVWANESWGRYWGWDPKETWALVTVVVYAFVIHMRMVPGLRGVLAFNTGSLLAISSVIMTYFGVNYYLSGLHSYAKGDPLPVPTFVYITLAIIFITAIVAGRRSIRLFHGANTFQEEAAQ